MLKITKIYTAEEADAMNEEAIAKGFYRFDRRIFLPGTGYETPWYWDPTGERERLGKHVMIKQADKGKLGFLSRYYWENWADKRPPICLVLPNGEMWDCDRKSSNGEGWIITGEGVNITASPSIAAKGYHGWLKDGVYSEDVDGRGEFGIWPYPEEKPRTT